MSDSPRFSAREWLDVGLIMVGVWLAVVVGYTGYVVHALLACR